ncbi:ShlB/FhaC/HecB family hemolysin secretion/activation protein [Leptothermofonsia sichuanensis]|uniref:ShlB/FhaC/HecB family hemolysin secretion/activation protein n=1 Tax=Leptothermofonsia sichuanensis TaxID=2917832 RepID=UPI001CEDAA33|nr:ShlB/FhaC/HecB family hemolysin secretion/activation protein [Leptothermofonsia sichuanensis]
MKFPVLLICLKMAYFATSSAVAASPSHPADVQPLFWLTQDTQKQNGQSHDIRNSDIQNLDIGYKSIQNRNIQNANIQKPPRPVVESLCQQGWGTDASISCFRLAQTSLPGTIPQPTNSPVPDPGNPLLPPRPDIPPLPDVPPTPPPEPLLETPPPTSPPPVPTPEATVRVKRVEVLGSTVFSEKELNQVVQPFENRDLTFEQLLEIRTAVTKLYTDRGYTTSGAFLPPQDDLASGVVRIQVVEGELEQIEIQGLRRVRENYVRKRLVLAGKRPLNISKLETGLQLLQLDPLFVSVQAELRAGTTPGRSVLTVKLTEARAFHGGALVENRNSPSVGSTGGRFYLIHDNLLGFGDRFNVEYGLTEGVRSYSFGYTIPLNPRDGTLSLFYTRNDSEIVEQPFSVLGINSNSETFSIGVRQPLRRTPTTEFALGLAFDLRRSQTFLLDNIPFSFSLGPENGLSRVSVLRFSQDWISRSPSRVLAARSQFSLGLPIFDATVNDTGTDGRFFSWVGQFQWVQSLGSDIIAIARVAAQLTPDSLLPLEQFSIGGIDTVRGYRQNQRVGDNGIAGSLEIRLPLVRDPEGIGIIQLAPFFDLGTVWNNGDTGFLNPRRALASVGVGLRWQFDPYLSVRLEYGHRLNAIDNQGNTLQDRGIYFSIRFQPF